MKSWTVGQTRPEPDPSSRTGRGFGTRQDRKRIRDIGAGAAVGHAKRSWTAVGEAAGCGGDWGWVAAASGSAKRRRRGDMRLAR